MSPFDLETVATGPCQMVDVDAVFQHYLQMTDTEPLHVACGAVAANQLEGDPYWQFLVAPPSGLKTELIRAFADLPVIYPLSNLTAQTFASGFQTKGKESPSLLMKLDGRVLALKDFTTILTMHRDKRGEILAQLREIYDGAYHKEFGNGVVVDWAGKVGLLAGVTPIIDTYWSVTQVLGERFLLYRLPADEPVTVASRAIRQQGSEKTMRADLRAAISRLFASITIAPVPIGETLLERFAHLAAFTASARSGVVWGHGGVLEYIPEPEGPGRLAKQFATLARGLACVRGTPVVTEADYLTVYRVAMATVPGQRRAMLRALFTPPATPASTTQLAERSGYPTETTRRYLQELTAMRLVDRLPTGPGLADLWTTSDLTNGYLVKACPDGGGAPPVSPLDM